jgi:hypothetical protein
MSDSTSHPSGGNEVSGNTFGGPTAAQTGGGNTQINNFLLPPTQASNSRRRIRTTVGVAATIVLIGAAALAVIDLIPGEHPGHTAQASTISTNTNPATSKPSPRTAPSHSAVPAPAASLTPDSDTIQWTGTVRIAEAGPRLDLVPPETVSDYTSDITLGLVDPPRISGDDGSGSLPTPLALWTGSKMPTRQDCSDLISTQGVWRVEVKKGTVLCARTHGGRIAVLTITSISNDFSTGEQAQATVWSAVSDHN